MTIIEQMLMDYPRDSLVDEKRAIQEVMQEVTLAGLARTDFFRHAAFYGGTALRIFHGLNRFSEGLDFSLLSPNPDFDFNQYIPAVKETVGSLGLTFEVMPKEKTTESTIKSAFLKGNTKEQFLIFYPQSNFMNHIHDNELMRIKFELDVNPPLHASTEYKYRLRPNNYQVQIFDKPSLFAGKIHAVLARNWKHRIKGRDFYDFVFYLATNTPVNLKHLEARLKQTKTIPQEITLTLDNLKTILYERFEKINFEKAKLDVLPFIKDETELDLWNQDFFKDISQNIKASV